jgi:membrane protein implicated in regulation of membrane protease activity
MTPRLKKLIGTVAMLVWLAVYALVATGVAVRVLPHAEWYVSLLFYVLAGTLWAIPIGMMFPWMHREPSVKN